jgi:hypothetical protein
MWNKGMTLARRLATGGMTVLAACVWLGSVQPASADAVTDWNEIAVTAVTAGRPGPPGLLDLALVQAAVHDAVQSYEGRFEPYHVTVPNPQGSPAAAVAAAAYGVLIGLYPTQQAILDPAYANWLSVNGLTGDAGLAVGQQAATALLTQYRAAPDPPLEPWTGSEEVGQWRPTPNFIGAPPPPPAPMAFLYAAFLQPFTLTSPEQFRPSPPPALGSHRYRAEYREVKKYGARFSADRSAEQTDLAYFWSENFVAQWNRALRAIAIAHVNDLGDSARLFALANLSAADAFIAVWDSKRHYNYWRPITAIREDDGDPRTEGDPNWEPLINTPPYPDYLSGANGLTAAFVTTLRKFFKTDDMAFTITSNAPLAVTKTRNYTRFSQAAAEVVEARILLGIHFRSADRKARELGSNVARWAANNYLRPVGGD